MKAVRHHSYGSPDVLVEEEVPTPEPGPGQLLIKVAATSFNPADAAIRAGLLSEMLPLVLPHVPSVDVAGTVAGLGEGVTGWSGGEAVVAFLPLMSDGAAAEYTLCPAELVTAAPAGVDLADAAALPSGALTAWQALFVHAGLAAGQSILVNGAGGAVGGYAVQLAHGAGARVTATASPRSSERVRGQGADALIDHTSTPVEKAVGGDRFDVVLNLVANSPEEAAALADLVADGGTFVTATTPAEGDESRGVRSVRMAVASDAGQLAELVSRVDAGRLRIDVADRRSLSETADVHRAFEAGRLAGKTIIVP